MCSAPSHTPSHACQRRWIAELAPALGDERRGRKRPHLRSGNVRLRKQIWKRKCGPARAMHHRTHASDERSLNLRLRCLMSGAAASQATAYTLGKCTLEEKIETRMCAAPSHAPSHAGQRRKIAELAPALSDEPRGRKRPHLRLENVRLRKKRWKRKCAPPRGMRHRTHASDERSLNLRLLCLMSGAAASDRIYARKMHA